MPTSGIASEDIRTDYLHLLVTQLRNQNPLEPMDNNDMAMQLAQLSQLEQMENMSTTFQKVLSAANRNHATSLIGKRVTFIPAGATTEAAGRVEGVEMIDQQPRLHVNTGLKYTKADEPATEAVHLDELDQTGSLQPTDTITVYGIKANGEELNGGNGVQIGLHDGQDFLTVGELSKVITDVFGVNGQEVSVASIDENGQIRLTDKQTGLNRAMHLTYNGTGRFELPRYSELLVSLSEITSITD